MNEHSGTTKASDKNSTMRMGPERSEQNEIMLCAKFAFTHFHHLRFERTELDQPIFLMCGGWGYSRCPLWLSEPIPAKLIAGIAGIHADMEPEMDEPMDPFADVDPHADECKEGPDLGLIPLEWENYESEFAFGVIYGSGSIKFYHGDGRFEACCANRLVNN